jgi:orotidine-5'-phosphate decarboxylase
MAGTHGGRDRRASDASHASEREPSVRDETADLTGIVPEATGDLTGIVPEAPLAEPPQTPTVEPVYAPLTEPPQERTQDESPAFAPVPQEQSFIERLRIRWQSGRTLLCIGLDGEMGRLPYSVRAGQTSMLALDEEREGSHVEGALVTFNQAIIDATADLVCAFKPNVAFYEIYGPAGLRALMRTIAYIHARYPDVPVILDAKRGDVSSTSRAYAVAAFETCDADAVTLQPYLGRDALAPFLERADRGSFILCRTSNPGAGEMQDLVVAMEGHEEPLYVALARRVANDWNALGNCGLVVGATYPEELRRVREAAPDLPILVPGIGAQDGDLAGTIRAGLDSQGQGLIISASRSVLYSSTGPDFANAARHEALRLWKEIDQLRQG